jgi:circadian clock protein KaiB
MSENNPAAPGRKQGKYILRLYIAGTAPNSLMALANLNAISKAYLIEGYNLEIIDILESPLRAIQDGILATPTLVKVSPPPETRAFGNLSDRDQVLAMLGLL